MLVLVCCVPTQVGHTDHTVVRIGPVVNRLALVMGAVVMAMGAGNGRFIAAACINVVVAANAGGASAPLVTSRPSWFGRKVWFILAIFSRCLYAR